MRSGAGAGDFLEGMVEQAGVRVAEARRLRRPPRTIDRPPGG
jgi:hypothetical protein